MRRVARIAGLTLCVCLGSASGLAESTDRTAYETLMKCFVADGLASDERHDAGDERKAAAYRAKARKSFDLTYSAGARIGLTDKQVSRDLDFAQDTELPRMVRDQKYMLSVAATCKALGLM